MARDPRRNPVSLKNLGFGGERSQKKPGFSQKSWVWWREIDSETGFLGKILGLVARDRLRNRVSGNALG
ncbi:hypothetical protein ACE1CM_07160 [Microseira sp. BLCC-F43]